MDKDQILALAKKAGFDVHPRKEEIRVHPDISCGLVIDLTDALSKFAALIAEEENQACAEIADHYATALDFGDNKYIRSHECISAAKAIRARSEVK